MQAEGRKDFTKKSRSTENQLISILRDKSHYCIRHAPVRVLLLALGCGGEEEFVHLLLVDV